MRPRVHTEKHLRQVPVDTLPGGTAINIVIANVVAVPTDNAVDVREGATISACYVEMWITADMAQPGSTTLIIEKVQSGLTGATSVEMSSLHTYENKKNIFFTTQGLTGDSNANPIPFIRGWYKIPKSKQRFGRGDSLVLSIRSNLENLNHCGLMIYKEQY